MNRRETLIRDIEGLNNSIEKVRLEYTAHVEKLHNEKKTLEDALLHIEALLKFEGYCPNEGRANSGIAKLQQSSITDAAYELLIDLHKPMHYREITLKLQEKGFSILGKDPAAILLSRMNRDKRFKRTEKRGVYALSTWRIRTAKRKRSLKSKNKKAIK